MKKITLFLIPMLFSISASAQLTFNWEAQPISEGNNMKSMNVVNDTMTLLAGYGRTFVKSSDQGETWDNVPLMDPEFDYAEISINSSGLGYALAGDVKVIDNPTTPQDVYADGLLLKTTDFGATWTVEDPADIGSEDPKEVNYEEYPNAVGCYARHFRSVEVLDDNSVFLSVEWYYHNFENGDRESYGGTMRSTDGISWAPVADSGYYSLSIEATPTRVYYAGLNHLFMADAASGAVTDLYDSLVVAEGGDQTIFINDITVVSDDEVYVVTTSNGIHKISDSGNWFEKLGGTGVPTGGNDLIVVNDTTILVLGTSTKSKITTDGGATWVGFHPGATCYEIGGILNDTIYGLGKSYVYKCAVADAIVKNNKWISQELKFNENMQKMAIIDANTAIIAGFGQTLVSTSDGGVTWTAVATPKLFVYGAEYDFESVSTLDTVSYVVAKRFPLIDYPSSDDRDDYYVSGLIYRSTDLWNTWELLDYRNVGTGTDPALNPNAEGAYMMDLSAMAAVNDTVVYMYSRWNDTIAGYENKTGHGNVFKTEDGGDSWVALFDDMRNSVISEILFIDEDNGFFLGNTFFRSTADGGATFTDMYPALQTTGSPGDSTMFIYGMEYVDASKWYIYTTSNGVLETTDGGVNYAPLAGISGGSDMIRLEDNTLVVLGGSTKSKISWDEGATWADCYPGTPIWAIGGILDEELVALAKTNIFKIPLVDLEPPSEAADILSFVLTEQTGAAVIDAVNHTITIEVAEGTDYTALSPTITISESATVAPASGAAQDFTNPLGYTVTAEDMHTSLVWTVTVTVYAAPSREANILTFVLAEQTGDAVIDAVNHTVNIEVAEGTNVSALTPTITISDLATITPASGAVLDFTNPVSYSVTAEDTEVSLVWTVNVTVFVPLSSDADILTFLLPEQTANAVIDAVNHTVTIDVEEGTNPAALTPMITVSAGATIMPASLTTQDFTNPVSYTVTAEDGETSIVWTVTVNANVGIEKLTMDDIRMYPNPVKEKLYLENLEMVDNVSIISITGSSVLLLNTPSPDDEIDMTNFEGGIYFIKFTDIDGGVSTKKFVKE